MSVTENVGGNSSTHAPTLDLHEIQATVLRLRPAPYFGSHVALRINDARAGRELLRRLIPHVDCAANWWMGASAWLSVVISYAGLGGTWPSTELATKLPRGIPRRDGGACSGIEGRAASTIQRIGSPYSAKAKSTSD